jgi:osmotically-inducible protein OsmY
VHADDQQIAQQIVQQLQQRKTDGQLTGFGIDLEVESGIVWLKGHVRSAEQQALVLDVARRVRGVEQVINDLQIQSQPAPAPAPPEPPKPQVKTALLNSGEVGLLKKPGELLTSLRGSVQRAFQPDKEQPKAEPKAEPKAKAEPKPKAKAEPKAEPKTEVAQLPAPTPAQLPALEQPKLARQPAPEAPQPRVHAEPASQVRRQPALPSDEQLAEAIIGRLRTQKERGLLKNFDVDVQVNERVVWVSGRVASDTQRNLVLDVSRRVRGVKQVVNDLNVAQETPVQVASAAQAAPVTEQPVAAAPTRAPAPFQYAPAQPQPTSQVPLAYAPARSVGYNQQQMQQIVGQPVPEMAGAAGVARARFDHPAMPAYAWPSYAAYPNYGAVTYPRQYSPTAWPYIGPFYPYPQVPLGWRKVTLEWDDGWWMLDFKSK